METPITKRFTKEQITELKKFYNEFKDHKWSSQCRQAALRKIMSRLDLSEKQVYTFCKNKKSRDKKKEIKNVMKQSNIRIPQTAKQCASVLSQQMRELFSEMHCESTSQSGKAKESFFDTFFQTVKRPKVDAQESEDSDSEAMTGDSTTCVRNSSCVSTLEQKGFGPVIDTQLSSGRTSSTSSTLSSPRSEGNCLPSLRIRDESNAMGLSQGNNAFLPLPSALLNTTAASCSIPSVNVTNAKLEMEARSILNSFAKENCLFNPLTDHQSRSLPRPSAML